MKEGREERNERDGGRKEVTLNESKEERLNGKKKNDENK